MQTGMQEGLPDARCFRILWINKTCPCTYPIQHELESPVVMVLVAIMTFMLSSSLSASFASALAISSALLLVADSWVCFTWRSSIRGWSRSMGQMSSQLPRLCPSTSTSRTKPSCTFRTRELWRAVSDAPVLSHHAAATCSPIMLVQHHAGTTSCCCNIMLVQHHVGATSCCCPIMLSQLVHHAGAYVVSILVVFSCTSTCSTNRSYKQVDGQVITDLSGLQKPFGCCLISAGCYSQGQNMHHLFI